MIFLLERHPADNVVLYDDLSLSYCMNNSMGYLARWAVAKGLDVDASLANDIPVSTLPVVWMAHSVESFDWMFAYAVHCMSEYHYRTNIQCPYYVAMLQTVKANRAKMIESAGNNQIQWWPLAKPTQRIDIVAFHNGTRDWAACETFELVQRTHRIYFETLNSQTTLRWTSRPKPTWLI